MNGSSYVSEPGLFLLYPSLYSVDLLFQHPVLLLFLLDLIFLPSPLGMLKLWKCGLTLRLLNMMLYFQILGQHLRHGSVIRLTEQLRRGSRRLG